MTPIEKLIDVVTSGIGAVAGPLLLPYKAKIQEKADIIEAKGKAQAMKIIAQAKADSTKLIAQAQAEVKDFLIHKQDNVSTAQINIEMDTANLIQTKFQFQERKRLNNLKNIVAQAKEKLPEQVSNKPVDPDWVARFFQYAQDVSTEYMKQIWSSILSGEVESPGRTSLRTLDILKNMIKKEAELFNEVMKYKIQDFILREKQYLLYNDILLLGELGLLQENTNLSSGFKFYKESNKYLGEYWDYALIVYKKINIPAYRLTKPAMELSSFLNHSADNNYLKLLAQFFKQEDCQLYKQKIIKKEGSIIFCDKDLHVIEP